MNNPLLTDIDRAAFQRDGYVIKRGLVEPQHCDELQAIARAHVDELIAPVEYEIDVHYPGAPVDPDGPGARTSRRLLQAYARHDAFRQWATSATLGGVLQELFSGNDHPKQAESPLPRPLLSQCHHNCVMTKAPGYSSATLWHQDNRYWSFDREDLISVWLALDVEDRNNGCLRVIPGSHREPIDPGRFDASLFLRPDLPENKAMIACSEMVELAKGDVLFFHSKLFHAAGRNLTDHTKFSVVFTYHQGDNHPIAGTRSDRFPSLPLTSP